MKPGTKSRKLGLQIPTVNPCNNFIVDYLIRNKIRSDKQVLSKSFLYNLAIQAVRKYPMPLISEEQLAALEGFGHFFIAQISRLIKRHYARGRLPTQKQMDQDDELHFHALRTVTKYGEQNTQTSKYGDHEQDLCSSYLRNSFRHGDKDYRPKKNTEPYHILQAMYRLRGYERAVTKGQINEQFFNAGRQKIRLWYYLSIKLQQYNLIEIDSKDIEFFYLTEKGKYYMENYEREEEERLTKKKGKKGIKQQQSDDSLCFNEFTEKNVTSSLGFDDDLSNINQSRTSTHHKSKDKLNRQYSQRQQKIQSQMQIKKTTFNKGTKFQSIDLLISNKDKFLNQIQKQLQSQQDISYQICQIQLASFLWAASGKILNYIVVKIRYEIFDEEMFRIICYRCKMTACEYVIIIAEKQEKRQHHSDSHEANENTHHAKQILTKESTCNRMLYSALATGFQVIKTNGVKETMKCISALSRSILQKLQIYEDSEMNKRFRRSKTAPLQQIQQIKHFGALQKFNQKVKYFYSLSTITISCLSCIPELHLKCIRVLTEKLPTLTVIYKKMSEYNGTRQRKLFLKTLLMDFNSIDEALNTLVQILTYDEY